MLFPKSKHSCLKKNFDFGSKNGNTVSLNFNNSLKKTLTCGVRNILYFIIFKVSDYKM